MLHRPCCLIAILGFVLTVGSTAAQVATPAASPVASPLGEQRILEIPNGQPFALSPDGRRIGAWRKTAGALEICAYDTETLAEERCAPFAGASVQADSGVWSPDSARLAFTENGARYLDETDIWVFDATSGSLTNLTEDGVNGGAAAVQPEVAFDFAPAWSPDGSELVFARGVKRADGSEQTTLERIAASGGSPTTLATVADRRWAVEAGIRWLPDNGILYSVVLPDDGPAAGLWRLAPDGRAPRQLAKASDARLGQAVLVGVAGNRALLLTGSRQFALVDLATGAAEPLRVSGRAPGPGVSAGFSPDGTKLLIVVRRSLILRNLTSGQEFPLGQLDQPIGSTDLLSGLAWASNNLAFGPSAANTGVLLSVPSR